MKTSSIVLIIIGSILLISLISFLVIKIKVGKDVVTGVSNDKIKDAAIGSGIKKEIAEIISKAPDSGAALESVGVSPVIATAIANGVTPPHSASRVAGIPPRILVGVGEKIYYPTNGRCNEGDSLIIDPSSSYKGYCKTIKAQVTTQI